MKIKSIFTAVVCTCALILASCSNSVESNETKDSTCIMTDSCLSDTTTVDSLTIDSTLLYGK